MNKKGQFTTEVAKTKKVAQKVGYTMAQLDNQYWFLLGFLTCFILVSLLRV